MPEFNQDAEISISVDEFLENCNDREIKEAIEWINDSHTINKYSGISGSISEEIFESALNKMHRNSFRLTREDGETIIKIANKIA